MDVRISEIGSVTVIAITGEVTYATVRDELVQHTLSGVRLNAKLVLDLSGVNFMSSIGVRLVLLVGQKTRLDKGQMVMVTSAFVADLFFRLGLLDSLAHRDRLDSALAALTSDDGANS